MLKRVSRTLFMSGAAGAALLMALPAAAQTQSSGTAQASPEAETVIVTGTRIKRPNLKSSSPITTVDAKDIQLQGVTAVETVLTRLPQFTADANDNVSNGSDGTANVNLRGLGSNRNLVLIDGQRFLPTLAVDTNFIPSGLVDRIDVVTGGASAVYGSDAISGVVNFIMKKNFEGISFDTQYSINQHTNDDGSLRALQQSAGFQNAKKNVLDGAKTDASLAFGGRFADGRGHVSGYVGYRHAEPVTQDARDYSACALNLADAAGSTFVCGGSGNHAYGRIDPLDGPNAGADYANAKDGAKTWVPNDGSFLYNYAPTNYIQRSDNRGTAGLFVNYKVNDKAELYGSFMFMDDHTFSQAAPSAIWLGTNFTINCDNPLMSAQQKTLLCGSTTSTADAHALVGYRVAKGAPRRDDLRHTDYRITGGMRGNLTDWLSYDVNMLRAQMVYSENYQNDVNQDKAGRGMQVVLVNGTPTCKSVVDGSDPNCVPVDIFSANGFSQAAYNYIYTPTFTHSEQTLEQYSGTLNADLTSKGWVMPWASEGLAVVVGAEHRKETLDFKADAAAQAAGTQNADGVVEATELFTELDLPILEDQPFASLLKLSLGARGSHYTAHNSVSTATSKDISTYKIETQYAPVRDLRLRASFNVATRAPNISELFAAQSIGNVSGQDPCAGPTPSATLQQCTLSGVTAAQYGHITECPADTCDALGGGNPGLDPETARTLTLGFVATPSAIRNLSVSLDHFDIKVDHYISTVDPQLAISQCIQAGDPYFCSLLHRDNTSGGILFGKKGYVIATSVNTGYLKTNGYDLNLSYRLGTSHGDIDFNLVGTYLTQLETEPLPGLGLYDCKGLYGGTCGQPSPKWRHTLRTTWLPAPGVAVSLNWRYFGSVDLSSNSSNPNLAGTASTLNAKIKAYNYLDLAGTWAIGHGVTLRGGINNMFDQAPPAIAAGLLHTFGNGNTYPGVYDPLGRTLFVGLTAKY